MRWFALGFAVGYVVADQAFRDLCHDVAYNLGRSNVWGGEQ